ncbi:flagellar protein FlbD [Hydrogenoanaerobacterium saccharovorans]|uniref:Flagellar protein FlbD n=1 Tax=Hydrogenoanaerobacterium saccharovorans TaxID=474960 RepID=A0A1H7ZT53_9FIRM|nr:flagellar FlbD family protein [Hydrogenoanaerobacterium saccharovorans]RPF48395.1 flagellar protein FlbD [Hydrogenoanaerobacterium saccharovorans]SEM61620.1 flagellar protein FlbD [Hydrogenoanaerobacterium saccharovorans]
MINLTKLNSESFILNCDLIESITENPDTTITLMGGKIFIVQESMQEVVQKVIDYRRKTFGNFIKSIIQ